MKTLVAVLVAAGVSILILGNLITFRAVDMPVTIPGVVVAAISAGLFNLRVRNDLIGILAGVALGVVAGVFVCIGLLALVFKPN